MLKIALTGNIASGKSQVERLLRQFGIPVIDADEIVAKLYSDKAFVKKISDKFENYDFVKNDEIDRERLAQLVFSDNKIKCQIEEIVHPFVFDEIEKFFTENRQKPCAVASIPLLFECGWQKYFDKIVLVTADEKERQKRLMARNNLTLEQAKIRIAAQMQQEEKIKLSDFVIDNNGSLKELEDKAKNLAGQLNGE